LGITSKIADLGLTREPLEIWPEIEHYGMTPNWILPLCTLSNNFLRGVIRAGPFLDPPLIFSVKNVNPSLLLG
jgi:hypothetical protein